MDLSKAFDTLDLNVLIEKLKHYGVRGISNEWFSSYLSNRSQFVEIDGHTSYNLCKIMYGVPQGSILGPLLFNIYINDFFECLTFGQAIMFADDTTLIFKCKDLRYLEAMVNEDLHSASEWLAENKLSLNIDKTNYMYFNMSTRNDFIPNIGIRSRSIQSVETQKFLGVIFDSKLSWKPHIISVINKLNSCLGATRRARPFLNKTSLLSIYYSLMQTHAQYCCTTWASWKSRGNQVILQRLQAVCNKYFRLIYNLERDESVREILKKDDILNVHQLYDYNLGQLMYKVKMKELPIPLQNNFQIGIQRPCMFKVSPSRIQKTQKSIYQSGPKVWNSLPITISAEINFDTFKTNLKKYIINK